MVVHGEFRFDFFVELSLGEHFVLLHQRERDGVFALREEEFADHEHLRVHGGHLLGHDAVENAAHVELAVHGHIRVVTEQSVFNRLDLHRS